MLGEGALIGFLRRCFAAAKRHARSKLFGSSVAVGWGERHNLKDSVERWPAQKHARKVAILEAASSGRAPGPPLALLGAFTLVALVVAPIAAAAALKDVD